jgi:integrase
MAGGAAVSALGEHLARYLALRLALGYRPSYDRWLTRFVAHLDIAGLTTVTADAAVEWAEHDASTQAAAAYRLVAVRGFASYLKAFDPATQVPGVYSGGKSRPVAHIYTSAEVEALMAAAAGLRPELWGQTMATLIGLLAATGIRPGEAYRLRSHDVDLVEPRLHLIDSKFGRSRQIPVDQSTVDALAATANCGTKHFRSLRPARSSSPPPAATSLPRRPLPPFVGCGAKRESTPPRADRRSWVICDTASRWPPCSTGTANASTSNPAYRCSPPTSGMSTRRRPTGICKRPPSCSPSPPNASNPTGR